MVIFHIVIYVKLPEGKSWEVCQVERCENQKKIRMFSEVFPNKPG